MLSSRKVAPRGSDEEKAKNKDDQAKYELKVRKLEGSCYQFMFALDRILDTPKKWKGEFDGCFREQLSKSRLFSRTSRVLHEMSKSLSKFKEESFNPSKLDDYVKAFEFTPEKVKNGYIKRSAIDDETIVNIFDFKIPTILMKKSNLVKLAGVPLKEFEKPLENSKEALVNLEERIKEFDQNIKCCSEYIKKNPTDKHAIETSENLKSTRSSLMYSKHDIKNYLDKLEKAKKKPSREYVSGVVAELERKMKELSKNVKNADEIIEDAKALAQKPEDPKGVLVFKSVEDLKNIFNNCKKSDVVKVTIAGNIKKISERAFDGCNNLVSVTLSKNCTEICNAAFANCGSLKVIDTSNITAIGDWAFSSCSSLEIINLKNVTKIGERAFSGCGALVGSRSGTLDTGKVTTIGDYAFNGCEKIKKIDLGKVTIIGEHTFSGCSELLGTGTGILNTGNVTEIGNDAFNGCEKLKGIDVGNVTKIGDQAFNGCIGLIELNLKKLSSIGNNAFLGCKGIRSVILPKKLSEDGFKDMKHIIEIQSGKKFNKSKENDGMFTKVWNAASARFQRATRFGNYIEFKRSKE